MRRWRTRNERQASLAPRYGAVSVCFWVRAAGAFGRADAATRRLDELAGPRRRRSAGLVLLEQLERSRRHAGSCRLDSDRDGYGSRDEMTTDAVRVYARSADGKIDRLRVLSATCPVETDTPVRDLGAVAADDNAHWLLDLAKQTTNDSVMRQRVGEDLLAALAINRGDLARDALAAIARKDARDETREQAVFWLALLRGEEGADIAASVMFNDKAADVRSHAAFAVSQSKSPQAAAYLLRLGRRTRTARSGVKLGSGWRRREIRRQSA